MLGAEARELDNHTAVVGRARLIDHIHHVEAEEPEKQIEQSSAIAMEELEMQIYRTLVLAGREMLICRRIAVGAEQRKAFVEDIHLAKVRSLAAVVVVAVADPDKTGESGKKAEVAVVGIADTAAVAEVVEGK